MSVYSQLVNINRWLLMVELVYVNTTLPFPPNMVVGCVPHYLPWLLDRLCTTNTKLCQRTYAQLSCIDGKCANLKVTGGRDGKREEINENNKMKESRGECYQKEIFSSERRKKLNVSEMTNEKGGEARKKTANGGNKKKRERRKKGSRKRQGRREVKTAPWEV